MTALKINHFRDRKAEKKVLPKATTIGMQSHDHQPSNVEKEEDIDIPDASIETVQRPFLRPFNAPKVDDS